MIRQQPASNKRLTIYARLGLPFTHGLVEVHLSRMHRIPVEGPIFLVELPVEARITKVTEAQEK